MRAINEVGEVIKCEALLERPEAALVVFSIGCFWYFVRGDPLCLWARLVIEYTFIIHI